MPKQNLKEKITDLLISTEREGIKSLIEYLVQGGFFESPASIRNHSCHAGGLVEHSFGVYDLLTGYNSRLKLGIDDETLIIAALLHDVCKMGAYIGYEKPYKLNRKKPPGHAALSLERIKTFIKLTVLEEMMIKYHSGVYGLTEFDEKSGEYPLRGDNTKSKEERWGKSLANAWYHNPIVKVMYFCDELATLEEKADEQKKS